MNEQPSEEEARRVSHLIAGFIRNDLTPSERQELDDWIAGDKENMKFFERTTDVENKEKTLSWLRALHPDQALEKVQKKIRKNQQGKKVRRFVQIAVAASLLIAAGGWWMYKAAGDQEIRAKTTVLEPVGKSIAPGSKKAMLIIPGRTIDLSDFKDQRIRFNDVNGAASSKGALAYDIKKPDAAIHTLQTPAGGEYQVLLADGTRAWLNAGTSLSYPSSFTGGERLVSVHGEVYFEVAENRGKPFRVRVGRHGITVMGTRFNVQAYGLDSITHVSLLEGAIRIANEKSSVTLSPGEEAAVERDKIRIRMNGSIDDNIAWTKGLFSFRETPIQQVMDQVGRWYDITVYFEKPLNRKFTGNILRNSSLEEVLAMLRLSGGVQFDIKGKQVTVRP